MSLSLAAIATAQSGGVAIGGGGRADTSAILDLRAENRGLLIPRVALVASNDPILSPAESLLVWNTSTSGTYANPGFHFWDGQDWKKLLLEDGAIAVRSLTVDGEQIEVTAADLNALLEIEGNVEERLANLEAGAGSVNVDLSSIDATLMDLQSQIAANDGDIAGIQISVNDNGSLIAGNAGAIATNASAIAGNDSDIAGLQTAVEAAQADADVAQADIDGFADALKNLTAAEVEQLENLDGTTVSAEQWSYLGSTNQAVAMSDTVTFAGLTSTGNLVLEGATDDDFQLMLKAVDPTADRAILFPDADGTVALLSDLTSVDGDLQGQLDGHTGDLTALQAKDTDLQGQITVNAAGIATNVSAIADNGADIAGLQTAVSGSDVDIANNANAISTLNHRQISAGTGLIGGGDLSADRSIGIADGGVNTAQLADNAATDAKVADSLTIKNGSITDSPVSATTFAASSSVKLPDETAAATSEPGMIRYNSAGGYLEFYHEVSSGVFAWIPVNSYAP